MNTATEHSLEHTFTREFIRDGLKRDHWDRCYLVLGGMLVAYVLLGWYFHSLGTPWHTPWLLATMAVCLVFIGLRLWLLLRKSVRLTFELWCQQAPDRRQRFRFEDDHMTVVMQNGENQYPYRDMRRLWRYPDVWLFEIVRNASVMFPVTQAPAPLKDFIVERVEAAGVKVKP